MNQHRYVLRATRQESRESAMVVLESGDAIGVTIRNVSNDGFMAEHESFVRIGSQVSLAWPGEGLRHAQVRWALSGRFGAAFEDGKAAGRQVLGTA